MLEGTSVNMRGLEEKDLAHLLKWRNQKEVRRFFFHKSLLTMSRQQKWFESYVTDTSREIFIAETKEDGKPIGMIGLYDIDHKNHKAELGSTMVGERSMQGKGIATQMINLLLDYAFADLNMNRVYAYVVDYNKPSIRAKKKCGFTHEGILRQDHYSDGAFHDVHLFGITRMDWNGTGDVT